MPTIDCWLVRFLSATTALSACFVDGEAKGIAWTYRICNDWKRRFTCKANMQIPSKTFKTIYSSLFLFHFNSGLIDMKLGEFAKPIIKRSKPATKAHLKTVPFFRAIAKDCSKNNNVKSKNAAT